MDNKKTSTQIGGIIFLIFIVVIILSTMFLFMGSESSQTGDKKDPQATQQGAEDSPLSKMEVAFIGNPSQREIRAKLDMALELYGEEINDENYSRAGSTLIALRDKSKTGVTEMEILDYMIRSHVDDVNMSFPDAAAISMTALEVNLDGDR